MLQGVRGNGLQLGQSAQPKKIGEPSQVHVQTLSLSYLNRNRQVVGEAVAEIVSKFWLRCERIQVRTSAHEADRCIAGFRSGSHAPATTAGSHPQHRVE